MVFFPTQPKSDIFLKNVPSDVCTGPVFVIVQCLYWFDVCLSPTCVPAVRRLYHFDVCKSDVCTVRPL